MGFAHIWHILNLMQMIEWVVPIGAVFGDPTDFQPQEPAESGGIQRTGKLSVRQWGC